MAITITTTVARVTPGSTPTATGTTASFTPAVGEMLVVCAAWDNTGSAAATISDSQGGTWTTVRSDSATDAPLTTNNITVIAYRLITTSASMTVTAASSGAFFQSFKVYRLSAPGTLSVGVTGKGGSSSANMTATAYTSTLVNSTMVVSAMTLLATATATSSDLTADTFFNGGLDDFAVLSGYKNNGAVGSETFNASATNGTSWHWAAIEVNEFTAAQAAGVIPVIVTTAGTVGSRQLTSGTGAAVVTTSGNPTIITLPQAAGAVPVVVTTTGNAVIKQIVTSGTVVVIANTAGTVSSRQLTSGTSAAVVTTSGTVGKIFGAGAAGVVSIIVTTSGIPVVTGNVTQGGDVLVLFNPDEVLTEGRVTYYQFDLLDDRENLIGTLQGVAEGDVSIDAYSAVKGTGSLLVYTDPQYRHLRDGQPDFLGVLVATPTGAQASSFGTSATLDILTCAESDALDISIGDLVQLTTSAGVLKEETIFTVTSKGTAFGFTNINYTPDSAALNTPGDLMVVVTVANEQLADWLNVRIRPMIRIQRLGGGDDPAGTLVPAGVYLCAAPVENWDATGLRRNVELIDKLSILDQDIASGSSSVITAYSALAGANIITLVTTLIAETGETHPAIQPDTKVLASPLMWDIGTTRLKIINDLLDAAGYFSLWVDGWGQYQATPYVQPTDRAPIYTSIAPFSDGPHSLMDSAWTRDRDIYSVPNRFLAVSQGDGETAALVSTATNVDPASPYSFPARGRWITQVEIGIEAVTQAALDTIARARLSSATSVTNQITLDHVFLPDLHINSVVHFVNPDSQLDIYCYVVRTTIPFDPTKLCQTTMRVVS